MFKIETCFITKMGTYNEMPQPFKVSTQKDFFQALFGNTVLKIEDRQVFDLPMPNDRRYFNIRIFWFGRCAFAVVENDWWTGQYTYYRIGCEHRNQSVQNLGRCYNRYTCRDCGYSENVDSSD